MKITRVRIHRIEGKLKERFGWSLNWTGVRTATLVEVNTDEGITGWGDGNYGGERLLAYPELVIGRSPFEMEAIFDDLREPAAGQFDRGEPTSAGLDLALWDIAGRALGKPVSALLGNRISDRVRPYCTCMYRKDWSDPAASLAEEARGWVARGHRILKMKIGYGPELDVEVVRSVRQAIGPDTGLAVDANCGYDDGTAVALGHELERFNLLWWEEPIWAHDLQGYDRLRRLLRIPLASGETMPADWIIRNYVQPRRVHIVQPDLDTVGLTGGRRLAYMCALNGIRLIPHNWGTHIRTAAALHWMSSFPEVDSWPAMFEFDQTESPIREAVIRQKIEMDPSDGTIEVPTGPGLGVEVIPEAVEEFRTRLTTVE
ncbi:MAG: mandelate racemase/muconate lactonizing enzyme family protein [Bryobacterales bacterium]|nr:mandelate racemase/muconate lactonizing enzyme family protein [Bryobacterales bacterium]